MRILEVALVVVLVAQLAIPLWFSRWARPLALWSVLIAILQFFGEGYRWQMLLLYGLALFLLLVTLVGRRTAQTNATRSQARNPGRRFGLSVVGLAMVLVAAALPAIFPIPDLPKPTGPYPVGTYSTMLVDASRQELYSGRPDEPRRIMVQFWYPATLAPGAQPGPWIDRIDIVGPSIAKWFGFPPFMLDHLVYARSHSVPSAALANGQTTYPVIFFSHGWNGIRVQSTFLMEELASQGYVVVSLDHAYGARVVVFPDGQIAENNPNALPVDAPREVLVPAAQKLVNQWAEDIGFVLDTLTEWNLSDPAGRWTGRLDLDTVGVSGHSTGGGAAIEFCGRDPRCKAGVGLDPYLTPVSDKVLDGGVKQPFLLLFSERFPTAINTQLLSRLMPQSPQAQEISIKGTAHYDFSDLPLLTPLAPYLGLKGPLNAQRVLSINRIFTLSLFDQALRGGSGEVLTGASASYPELEFGKLP